MCINIEKDAENWWNTFFFLGGGSGGLCHICLNSYLFCEWYQKAVLYWYSENVVLGELFLILCFTKGLIHELFQSKAELLSTDMQYLSTISSLISPTNSYSFGGIYCCIWFCMISLRKTRVDIGHSALYI